MTNLKPREVYNALKDFSDYEEVSYCPIYNRLQNRSVDFCYYCPFSYKKNDSCVYIKRYKDHSLDNIDSYLKLLVELFPSIILEETKK